MDYQLVLQFRGEALDKFVNLSNVENVIKEALSTSESFDGLDQGDHGANVFIYTENPAYTFQRLRPLLKHSEGSRGFTAAYRIVAENHFRILWPSGLETPFQLR